MESWMWMLATAYAGVWMFVRSCCLYRDAFDMQQRADEAIGDAQI
jgi:hypothetical protein